MNRRGLRRAAALLVIISGGLLLWLSPDAMLGAFMMVAGLALEALGVRLEHA